MRELTQIRDAVLSALRRAGLAAEVAFPAGWAKRYQGAVASVAVGAAEGKALGFCNYLGQLRDEDGCLRELYGKRLEGSISVDVRAEHAADCETGVETAAAVLLGGLPAGIHPGELRWEALTWEKETGMFLHRGTLSCEALFIAQADEEDDVFLDFILKGVMRQ